MKYKIGDKVRIRSLEWYKNNANSTGCIKITPCIFVPSMSEYCGKTATIVNINYKDYYSLDIDGESWMWDDYMFEKSLVPLIDKTKLPYNIGDRVKLIDGRIGTIEGYYFSYKFNDYNVYGYTVKLDDFSEGHNGSEFSYNEYGEKIESKHIFNCKYYLYYEIKEVLTNKKQNIMEKEDLKPGMLVEFKDYGLAMVTIIDSNELVFSGNGMWFPLYSIDDDFKYKGIPINKVFSRSSSARTAYRLSTEDRRLLWERPKEITLTMQEIADKFGIDVNTLKIKK